MKNYNVVFIIVFVCIMLNCSPKEVGVKGFIFSIEEKLCGEDSVYDAHYSYFYKGKSYIGSCNFKVLEQYAYYDSVIILFSESRPEKSRLGSVFFRSQEVEISIPELSNSIYENPIITYNSLSEKPVFNISQSANNNKSKLKEYVYNEKSKSENLDTGRVSIKLIISIDGGFERAEILSSSGNEQLDKFVEETIMSLSGGTPGRKQDGKAVRTSLIVEFKF